MHDALQKEIATYEKRTPKSAAATSGLWNAFRSALRATTVTTSPIRYL